MPPMTPTGTPMAAAIASRTSVPTIALAIPPPSLAGRLGQLGEETPVQGGGALRESRNTAPERSGPSPPTRRRTSIPPSPRSLACARHAAARMAETGSGRSSRVQLTLPVPLPASVRSMSCATTLTRIVTASSTRPSSNSELRYKSVVASVNSFAITLASV